MLNQLVCVGRIKEIAIQDNKVIVILTVPRSYKNIEGNYENDYIEVEVFGKFAETVKKYCEVKDLIGVKGRLAKLENDKAISVIAEKVTFLSTKKNIIDCAKN